MTRTRRALGVALEILVPVGALVAWALWSEQANSYFFPPLVDIFQAFADIWIFDRFTSDIVPSLMRLFVGFGIACALGIVLGLALGMSPMLRAATDPVVQFLRSIPPTALIPPGILVLGVGDGMKIAIIAFVCVWPVLLNTMDGVAGIDPTLRDTARMYGIPFRARVLRILLPASSPQAFAGMRTSLSLAIILMVVSELVASTNGIGYFVLQSQRTYAITDMWAGIVLLGVLGYALNLVFVVVERRVLRWHRGARAGGI